MHVELFRFGPVGPGASAEAQDKQLRVMEPSTPYFLEQGEGVVGVGQSDAQEVTRGQSARSEVEVVA